MIYNNKIWHEYIDRTLPSIGISFAAYNLETNEIYEFDRGGIDSINGKYIYYKDNKTRNGTDYNGYLYRMNCDTFYIEQVLESKIEAFDFYNGYLLYATQDNIYRMNESENKKMPR